MDSVLDLSFFLRLLILLLVLGVLAGIDYLWHKERATRWRRGYSSRQDARLAVSQMRDDRSVRSDDR